MHWYDPAHNRHGILLVYALAAALAGTESAILALALNPKVHPDYGAFYIDQTTTCLNRDVLGSYSLGQIVSFRRDGRKSANNIKVCGWTGPAGDGTHSLGDISRLRVNLANPGRDLLATLEMSAVLRPPTTQQRVLISVNGRQLAKVVLADPNPSKVMFEIPGGATTLEISFAYLDGFPPNRSASNIYKRAIRIVSFMLEEASD